MKAIHIHNVVPLPLDDSWLLLRKKVTKNAKEESDVESLKDIGMKIVKKCHGLPLAITAIGGILCGKLSRWEWERVERSPSWSQKGLPDGIHQALYLSYEDLPSHLKQCFLHCSLFREDSRLEPEHLTRLWIAEGFVVQVEKEKYPSLEEIAQGYFDELTQRSLLQRSPYTYGSVFWTIHDVLRSLCHFLAKGENSVITITETSKQSPSITDEDSIKLRRLSVVAPNFEDIKPFLRSTQRYKSMRTLLLEALMSDGKSLDDEEVDNCFNNFQHLRIIRLSLISIQSLPQSVGNLLHLRYLDLSNCSPLKALPESIASLKYLQFLFLNGCINLQTLPEGLVNLRNLRMLDLFGAPVEKLPSGIARLEHLNVLKGAVVGSISSSSNSGSSCSLEEISQLPMLRQLSINAWGMISAKSNTNVNELHRSLTALEDLVALHLFCCAFTTLAYMVPNHMMSNHKEEDIERIEPIFDVALHPPSSVHEIRLLDFFGRQFPRWLMSSNISSLLPNLTNLYLEHCDRCSLLPPLGKLPNLEKLALLQLKAVTRIDTQFFGYEEASTSDGLGHESGGSKNGSSSPSLFPCLKQLCLLYLFNLEVFDWVPEDGRTVAMPRLEELKIHRCPKLLSLPTGLFHQATRLTKANVTWIKH